MNAFTYLTGRKELFDGAPAGAMVVLETNEAEPRLFYAVAHEQGASYWNADGSPGSRKGLIALFNKTRVVASRTPSDGKPAEPKRDPIPNARLQRMQAAQAGARKAASGLHSGMNAKSAPAVAKAPAPAPAPAAAKPACQCNAALPGTHHRMCPEFKGMKLELDLSAVKIGDVGELREAMRTMRPGPIQLASDPVASSGFVSLFEMAPSSRGPSSQSAFITVNRSGNLTFSTKLLAAGDTVDIQLDLARNLIRVGKVQTGGRTLPKSKVLSNGYLVKLVKIPEGEKSVRIFLTEADGWWQGEYPKEGA